jgi:hypothetical protein
MHRCAFADIRRTHERYRTYRMVGHSPTRDTTVPGALQCFLDDFGMIGMLVSSRTCCTR